MPTFSIKGVTVDITSKTLDGLYNVEKNLNTETWYPSAKCIIPLYARKSGQQYICSIAVENGVLRAQADSERSEVNVGLLVIS